MKCWLFLVFIALLQHSLNSTSRFNWDYHQDGLSLHLSFCELFRPRLYLLTSGISVSEIETILLYWQWHDVILLRQVFQISFPFQVHPRALQQKGCNREFEILRKIKVLKIFWWLQSLAFVSQGKSGSRSIIISLHDFLTSIISSSSWSFASLRPSYGNGQEQPASVQV